MRTVVSPMQVMSAVFTEELSVLAIQYIDGSLWYINYSGSSILIQHLTAAGFAIERFHEVCFGQNSIYVGQKMHCIFRFSC